MDILFYMVIVMGVIVALVYGAAAVYYRYKHKKWEASWEACTRAVMGDEKAIEETPKKIPEGVQVFFNGDEKIWSDFEKRYSPPAPNVHAQAMPGPSKISDAHRAKENLELGAGVVHTGLESTSKDLADQIIGKIGQAAGVIKSPHCVNEGWQVDTIEIRPMSKAKKSPTRPKAKAKPKKKSGRSRK